ncbi:Inner membrane protein ygaZ [Comamonas thiooxydans]|nr:Inner membrane protein ygaZ [Comamonas thiooxydans]
MEQMPAIGACREQRALPLGGAAGGGMKKPGESGLECPRMAPALSHRSLKLVRRHKKSAHCGALLNASLMLLYVLVWLCRVVSSALHAASWSSESDENVRAAPVWCIGEFPWVISKTSDK